MTLRLLLSCIALGLFAACAAETMPGGDATYPQPTQANVPPGHMPPPGKCRIWFADRAPGQQPPPGECAELRNRVPPGATLIQG